MGLTLLVVLLASAIGLICVTRERVIRCEGGIDDRFAWVCLLQNRWASSITVQAVILQDGRTYIRRLPKIHGLPPRDSTDAK